MAKCIRISVKKERARQYALDVNDLNYGEWMHLQNAVGRAEFLHGALLDLIDTGMIDPVEIILDIPTPE